MTCDLKCSLPKVFNIFRDLWHGKKMFIWGRCSLIFKGPTAHVSREKNMELSFFLEPVLSLLKISCDLWLLPRCSVHRALWRMTWTLGRNSTVIWFMQVMLGFILFPSFSFFLFFFLLWIPTLLGGKPTRAYLPIGWVVTCQLPARQMPASNHFTFPSLLIFPKALKMERVVVSMKCNKYMFLLSVYMLLLRR